MNFPSPKISVQADVNCTCKPPFLSWSCHWTVSLMLVHIHCFPSLCLLKSIKCPEFCHRGPPPFYFKGQTFFLASSGGWRGEGASSANWHQTCRITITPERKISFQMHTRLQFSSQTEANLRETHQTVAFHKKLQDTFGLWLTFRVCVCVISKTSGGNTLKPV